MSFLRKLFGPKLKSSTSAADQTSTNKTQPARTPPPQEPARGGSPDVAKANPPRANPDLPKVNYAEQDARHLVESQHFEVPVATQLAKVTGEIRQWYRERALAYTGRFGGRCDDCARLLVRSDSYLTGTNGAICEDCLNQTLFRHINWNEALQNLQRWIGSSGVQVPPRVTAAAQAANQFIVDHKLQGTVDSPLLKEVEAAMGQTIALLPVLKYETGAVLADGFVVELALYGPNPSVRGNLTSVPVAIVRMSKLKRLDILNHRLASLPDTIGQVTSLEKLTVNRNFVTHLPTSLGDLAQLRELSLYDNQLVSVPDSLCRLSNLTSLILSNNRLASLPEGIQSLQSLEWLMVGHNLLQTLPAGLLELPRLKRVGVEKNPQIAGTSMPVITALREKGCSVDL